MIATVRRAAARSPAERFAGPRHGAAWTLVLHLGPGLVFTATGPLAESARSAWFSWWPLELDDATWRTRAITLAIAVHVALNLSGDTLATIPIVFR